MSEWLYRCEVGHWRQRPIQHRFRYPMLMLGVDVEGLASLGHRLRLFSHNKFNVLSIRDQDYLSTGKAPLLQKLARHLVESGIDAPLTSARLLTGPRYFGQAFNPISFFWCYSSRQQLVAIVVEVRNTYGEAHVYVLNPRKAGSVPKGGTIRLSVDKEFFVSPFNGVQGRYDFAFSVFSEETLKIDIDLVVDDEVVVRTWLLGKGRPLELRSLLSELLRRPIVMALTVPRIAWQALRLKRAGLRARMKPLPTSPGTRERGESERVVNSQPASETASSAASNWRPS